ncbi:MAG: ABC transporter ATP-binding protein [Spirochaetales bacterium]|nr:ABC transporter ATP-binding protein [Spirochaetales bacterium]
MIKKLLPFLKPHSRRLFIGLIGMTVFTALSLLPPLIMRYLVNDVIQAKAWDLLLPVIIMLISVPVLSVFIQFVNTWLIRLSGYNLVRDIRLAIYKKIFSLSMDFHQENASGLLVNRLMDDVNAVMRLVTGETVTLLIDIIVFICSVTIVFVLSPLLGLILIGMLFIYVFAYRFYAKRIRSSATSFRYVYDRISERLEETITGARHVRIYNREPWENEVFLDRTNESLKHSTDTRIHSVTLSTICNMIAGFGSAAVTIVGSYFVLKGDLEYGDIFAIGSYIWMALNPAIRLTNVAAQMTETFVSVRRIFEILDTEPMIRSLPGASSLQRGLGAVEFRDVHFSYVSDVPLYQGLSLNVEPGMSVALVGHTGCGKTTMTSLLMRHWNLQEGQILVDGTDISTVDLGSLRRNFGVVLQDPIIFDGTVAENISYGVRNVTRAQIEDAAKVAEIYDMAMRLPDGFDSLIGTIGIKLSVGEKQRLSIARAIIKDPVILIMDEATSSLDSESEALIQKALDRILKERTSFIVAHRLSTITSVDMIVVMDDGAIVEKGRHTDLMEIENGTYRQLYEELRGSVVDEADSDEAGL